MARIIFIYGLVAGLIIIAGTIGTVVLAGDQPHGNVWLGYLIMLLGMSAVFMGVKRYRDRERGGVIRFLPALGIGLAIALIASLTYVLVWEVYLAATDYAFMDQYIAATLEARRAEGLSGDAYHIMDRSTILIDKGYHPCAVLPGYEMYYFTILGGLSQRSLKQYFQPTHAEQLHTIPGIMDMVAKFK